MTSGLLKLSAEVLAWSSVWIEVQMICIWSSKIQRDLPFWCQFTQVVLEKRPLNRCSSNHHSRLDRNRLTTGSVVKWHKTGILGGV